jgi:2'-5' RNA ligase
MNKTFFYSQLWEYLLLVNPPAEVQSSISKIKKEVEIKYESPHAVHTPARISLVRFFLMKGHERNLMAQLFSFFVNSVPVEIILKDFDVFPRHTLYVNVREDTDLKKLQRELSTVLTGMVREQNVKPVKNYYMTIARNLNPEQYESISGEYKRRRFDNSFRARNVILLKRPYDENNSKSCRWSGSHNFVMGF